MSLIHASEINWCNVFYVTIDNKVTTTQFLIYILFQLSCTDSQENQPAEEENCFNTSAVSSVTAESPASAECAEAAEYPEGTVISDEQKLSDTWSGSRCELKCPGCVKTFQCGRAKLHRLLKHIEVEHGNDLDIQNTVKNTYPPKIRKSKTICCPVCKELKSGGKWQLDLHLKRKQETCIEDASVQCKIN